MHPILLEFGPIQIRFYGLMYVVAILMASYLVRKEVARKGIALGDDDITGLIIWCVVGGVVLARLYYVVFNFSYYAAYPLEIPAVWHGGLAIHGGIVGGVGGGWLYLRRKRVAFWRMCDAVAPSLIIGQAFGRFGNFMNGDAHGVPTDAPWGVVFPEGSIAGNEFPGIPTHPSMLYEMVINFSIFTLLWFVLRKRETKDGFIFAAYIALYSIGRFFVEFSRADSLMMGPLKAAQMVSIAIVAVTVIIVASKKMWSAPDVKEAP